MIQAPQRERSAEQVIGDVLFVAKFVHRHPNEYKKIYANANISAGEAALSTGIEEEALISAMININKYQCDNRKIFPLRYVVDLIAHESFLFWRKSYKYEVKDIIKSFKDDKLRSGLLELFSTYLSGDNDYARMFEDTMHVIAEYLRMNPIDNLNCNLVNINNINKVNNEINIDFNGLRQALGDLIETLTRPQPASNVAPPHQPSAEQESPSTNEAQTETEAQNGTASTESVDSTSKVQPIPQGGSRPETDKIKATKTACGKVAADIEQGLYLDKKRKIGVGEFVDCVKGSMTADDKASKFQATAAKSFFKSSDRLAPFKRRRGEK